MKIYLAGPMRGYRDLNFPAFDAAAALLRARGHEVFSPAERDRRVHGEDFGKGVQPYLDPPGFVLREALRDDLAWLCESAEAVVVLNGWNKSAGATSEYFVARAIGIPVYSESEAP
jgi:nucleoside 2-deoxyribosyltransferase